MGLGKVTEDATVIPRATLGQMTVQFAVESVSSLLWNRCPVCRGIHICRSQSKAGRHVAAFNPVTPENVSLFQALLAGEFHLNSFRNRDLQGKLYPAPPTNPIDAKRRTHRTSRLIAKLRGHGLIAKVTNSRLYRVTHTGVKAMWAAVRCRCIDFPTAFNMSESFAQ